MNTRVTVPTPRHINQSQTQSSHADALTHTRRHACACVYGTCTTCTCACTYMWEQQHVYVDRLPQHIGCSTPSHTWLPHRPHSIPQQKRRIRHARPHRVPVACSIRTETSRRASLTDGAHAPPGPTQQARRQQRSTANQQPLPSCGSSFAAVPWAASFPIEDAIRRELCRGLATAVIVPASSCRRLFS